MYFTKNEIIELNDNSKYLVIDSAYIDNEAYYKVEKIADDKHTNEFTFISAKNDNGKLYITKKITQEITYKLEEICQ